MRLQLCCDLLTWPSSVLVSLFDIAGCNKVSDFILQVLSIKLGMWDSIYDTVQAICQYDVSKPLINDNIEYESINVEQSMKDAPVTGEPVVKDAPG